MKRLTHEGGTVCTALIVMWTWVALAVAGPLVETNGPSPVAVQEIEVLISSRNSVQEETGSRTAFSRIIRPVRIASFSSGREEVEPLSPGYVEIASGLHYRDSAGQWLPSVVEPVLNADGSVSFDRLPKRLHFAASANLQTVVTATKADGVVVRTAVAGLAYVDAVSGKSAVFASPRSSSVQAFGRGVYYTNAFNGIDADIVYKVERWGMEQDIVIYGNVPPPEWFGLGRGQATLCVLTEIVGIDPADLTAERSSDVPVGQSKFGSIAVKTRNGGAWQALEEFQSGYSWLEDGALDVGAAAPISGDKTPVKARLFTSAGRTFLCEELPFKNVEELDEFAAGPSPVVASAPALPPQRPLMAEVVHPAPRDALVHADFVPRQSPLMVLDYVTYSGGSISNDLHFVSGQTYYISGFTILYGARLRIDPGAIIKIEPGGGSIKLDQGAYLDCRSHLLNRAIFTTSYDTDVGEAITNKVGLPQTNKYYNALELSSGSNVVSGIEVRHTLYGVAFYSDKSETLRDSVFTNCDWGVGVAFGTNPVRILNSIFSHGDFGVINGGAPTLIAGCTFNSISNGAIYSTYDTGTFFTNNIFATISGQVFLADVAMPTSASHNARWNSAAGWIGASPNELGSSPFTSGTYGVHYLQSGSPLVDYGTQTSTYWGLYHYTTATDGHKESNTLVDTGFHYGTTNDLDGDGLYDFWEDSDGDGAYASNSLDISSWMTNDTDGDGLWDGSEYTNYFTNPKFQDTDGDGVSDGLEVAQGSDPLNATSKLVSVSGTISYSGGQTGNIRVILTSVPRDDSLSLEYTFDTDSGTNVYDWSGRGNDGFVYSGATFSSNGVLGGAYSFNGSSGYMRVPRNATLDPKDFTLAAWIKTSGAGSSRRRVISQQGQMGYGCWIMTLYNNVLELGSDKDNILTTKGSALNNNAWRLVSVVRDTTNDVAKWFVDGVEVGTQSSVTNNATWAITDKDVQIGRVFDNAEYFSGYIDNLLVYRRPLASNEVYALYRQGSATNLCRDVAITGAESYTITNIPNLKTYWVYAFRDSDGNGLMNSAEARGYFAGNAIYLNDSSNSVNITLSDPDSDSDGMPDWWETANGLNVSSNDAALDPDLDQLNNSNEYIQATNPQDFDSDDDLLADGPELARYGTEPTNPDSDGDGYRDDIDKLGGGTGAGTALQIYFYGAPGPGCRQIPFVGTTNGGYYEFFDLTNLLGDQTWLLATTAVLGVSGTSTWNDCGGAGRDKDVFIRLYFVGLVDDFDHDGLGSAYECVILGTSPDMTNTDGDALSDAEEDPDGDGLGNGGEYNSQLSVYFDPCRPGASRPDRMDSDNDGVSDGPTGNGSSITNGPDHFPMDAAGWQDTDCDGKPDSLNTNHVSNSEPPLEEDLDDDNDGFSDVDEIAAGSNPKSEHSQPPPSMLRASGKYIVDDQTNKVILKSVNIGGWLSFEQWMLAFEPKIFTNSVLKIGTNNMDDATLQEALVNNVDFGVTLFAASNNGSFGGVNIQTVSNLRVIGNFNAGNWLRFSNVNFGAGVSNLSTIAVLGDCCATRTFEVWLDSTNGTLVGSGKVADTGAGWGTLSENKLPGISVSGTHDVYFVSKIDGVGNMYRFRFYRDTNARQLMDTFTTNYFRTNDIDNLKSLGYNCLRVPFPYNLIQDGSGTNYLDAGWKKLDWVVEECRKRHMWCILDLHGAPGSQNYFDHSGQPEGMRSVLWNSQVYKDRTAALWKQVASRYRTNSAVAGFDVFNEPDAPRTIGADTNIISKAVSYTNYILPVLTSVYAAIRSATNSQLVFMMSNFQDENTLSNIWYCPAPSSKGWSNIVYEFHHYDGVHYAPTNSSKWTFEAQKGIVDQIVQAYTRFSEERQVPVFIGEFGPIKMQNFDYYIRQFEASGIHWANWNFRHWGHDDQNTNILWSSWGLDYRTGAVYGVINTNIQPNVKVDSFATLSNKLSQYTAGNYAPHPYLRHVIQNGAANTNVPSARTEFYLNTFSGPNLTGLNATNAWPWRKLVALGGSNDSYEISGGRARAYLGSGTIRFRLKSRDEADARFEVADSIGGLLSLDLVFINVTNTVAGAEADVRLAFTRDSITNGIYKDASPALVARFSYDQSAGSTNVSLVLYWKAGVSNTYGTVISSNTIAFATGETLRVSLTASNASVAYNGVTNSGGHSLSNWPGGAVCVAEVEDIATGSTWYAELDNFRAGRPAASFDSLHVNSFTNYPAGIYALAEPENLSIRTWDRTNDLSNSYLTNSSIFCIPERISNGWQCVNPRRDYLNDVRLNLTATNVVEARAAYSNFTEGIGRICVLPEYLPGSIRTEYKGDCLYVDMQRSGADLQFTAYRQWDVGPGEFGRTNIAPSSLSTYVAGRGVSMQVSTNKVQVYYGANLVADAEHLLPGITGAFGSGVYPHFEFLNAPTTTTAAVQIGGLRCRALSTFTMPSE